MGITIDRVESVVENGKRGIKSFVLRGTRLAAYQERALELYSDEFVIPFSHSQLDFSQLFGNDNPVIVEIGFGMGQTTKRIAIDMPNKNFLGIEVFLNGFTKLLHEVGTSQIENIRLMRFDAVEVLEHMIPDASVSGFHIFFPDPWPKKKHHKRRLVQIPLAQLLAKKLKRDAYIYCVTDWEPYAYQMLDVFNQIDCLENPYSGFAPSRSWRPTTNFEKKGIQKSHPIHEVWVEKRS
jgi:tRNA (guanine-N7-)-methyltransferase